MSRRLDAVIETIDKALADRAISPDAMRWSAVEVGDAEAISDRGRVLAEIQSIRREIESLGLAWDSPAARAVLSIAISVGGNIDVAYRLWRLGQQLVGFGQVDYRAVDRAV